MRKLGESATVEKQDLTSLESALQNSYKDASDTPSRVGGNACHSQKSSNKLGSDVEAFTHISMFSPHNNGHCIPALVIRTQRFRKMISINQVLVSGNMA